MIGKTVSHYRIMEKLGSGGMGVVYKAHDRKLDRDVALKFLPQHLTSSEEEKKRFIHEAQAASSLEHNNICAIHEIDETDDGQLFISMGYYEGDTLQTKIKDERLKIKDAINYTMQIVHGLQKAHEKNIVHRDIKPANIMLTDDDVVKILDFGLAKLASQTKLTKEGTTLGTIAYMSPEQTRGEKVDHRTDIWSLGVILYEMLTGELPFKGEYEQAVMYSIMNEEPEFVSKIRNDVPLELEKIINKALHKNPDKRFQTMQELCEALENTSTNIDAGLSKTVSVYRLGRKQRRLLIRISPVVVVLLSIFVYFIFIREAMATPVSIVLLPLENLTRDIEQEWFTDGMTDALITDLARISGLRIISRSSAMKYKNANKSSAEIASELGVSYVIEGSVQKLNNQVKITTRLIEASTDEYLWAQDYERPFTDILALQGDVATEIARQIRVNLTDFEESSLSSKGPVNPEAYEAYLKGNFYLYKLTPEGLETALQYFKLAAKLDPEYALAYTGIALANCVPAQNGYISMEEAFNNAKPAVQKALELDDSLPEVHYMRGLMAGWYEWDWILSVFSLEKAIKINPNMAIARAYYSHILFILNKPNEGLEQITQALELDPFQSLIPCIICNGFELSPSI